jgi:hypothetical protein
MKVTGPSGAGQTTARGAPRSAAEGFALPDASPVGEALPASRAASVIGVSSIEALLTLQAVGEPLEKRRKAVRRAETILGVLDEIKLSLLDGGVPPAALDRLVLAVRLERGGADDSRLQALLDEIETRAAVELAKIEMSTTAA